MAVVRLPVRGIRDRHAVVELRYVLVLSLPIILVLMVRPVRTPCAGGVLEMRMEGLPGEMRRLSREMRRLPGEMR